MTSKSKSKSRKKTRNVARKSARDTNRRKESEYPNIIEEPIRVIGDQTQNKPKAARTRKK